MATMNYGTVASRNLIRAAREMLKHAEPILVMSPFAKQEAQPKNQTDTVVFRRVLPVDAAANGAPRPTVTDYLLSEGTTPNSKTISYQDVQATVQNYGILMRLSSKAEGLYEDDIPKDMVQVVGEHMAQLEELINFGVVRAGTNVLYSNGSARTDVNTPLSRNVINKAVRTLQAAHAWRLTSKLSPSPDFGTSPVPESFVAFIHTDAEHDVSQIPGFVPAEEYSQGSRVSPREYGKAGQVRFVSSPMFTAFANAGSATTNGMYETATEVDVYTAIVIGKEAFGQVAVKGFGSVTPVYLPAKQRNHANPMGMFGYVGADFWKTSVRLNENWMVRIEHAVTAL
jgi:N4-gp56 family major capsid protein